MSDPRELPGPLDLTDRHVLARWLIRVREHVTELDKPIFPTESAKDLAGDCTQSVPSLPKY